MDIRVDLHLHSTASDGRWTPEQLVAEVKQAGIDLFAVTDHDSLGSLRETAALVQGNGLRFLPGVELSATLDGQLYHLLGYAFDMADPALNAFVQANNARLAEGGDEAIRLLIEAGYPISLDQYATYTWDRRRGGWKALNYLIDNGFCRDVHSYFGELFGESVPHPWPTFPSPEEVIAAVQGAGGVVVLAHPGAGFYHCRDLSCLDALLDMGVEGLECYSSHHDETITERLLDYCRNREVLITGGSDCHGGFAGRALGVPRIYAGNLRLDDLEERAIW
jgi:predicted metal-dependent phosphoesterase TrpH